MSPSCPATKARSGARHARRRGGPYRLSGAAQGKAGGGGKGMRRVDTEAEIAEAIAAAQREALSAFGDSD